MAMIAVRLVVEKLGTLLAEEAQLLGGVGRGVAELQDDLESMRSFLQDAEARSESDKGVKTWVKQVRDVAYNTEDILEEFLLRLSPPQGSGFFHILHKGYHHLRQLRARHRLAVQIEEVKRKVKAISERRNAFSFKRIEEATTSPATTTLQTWNDPRLASLFLDDADVVGIENPKSLLISWLVGGEQNLTAVSVVGMGGVGKTTLVKKVYDSQAVKKYFDHHAWITVSQSFTAAELLRAALKDFLEEIKEPIPQGIDTMDERQLINKLRVYLQQKRCHLIPPSVSNPPDIHLLFCICFLCFGESSDHWSKLSFGSHASKFAKNVRDSRFRDVLELKEAVKIKDGESEAYIFEIEV